MQLLFCRSHHPGSYLIRVATWSQWSHVALVDGDMVIEAVWPQVQLSPLSDVVARYTSHAFTDLSCRFPKQALAAALNQVGKPYDLTALVGMAMRRNWQEDDSWFCSELVAWAFSQGGTDLFRVDKLWRVTPQHLWMLAPINTDLQQPDLVTAG